MDGTQSQASQVVSAQVVLKPAGGRSAARANITSENIQASLPSPENARRARDAFAIAGFDTGPLVGNSFSISAPLSTFEQVFRVALQATERGVGPTAHADSRQPFELPLQPLPESLGGLIEAVTFGRPPDFGPTSFGP